jgi:RNA processing factor Prp31
MLAGKISIAAKIDAFEGEAWTEHDVVKVEERVEAIREAHKQPPPRR